MRLRTQYFQWFQSDTIRINPPLQKNLSWISSTKNRIESKNSIRNTHTHIASASGSSFRSIFHIKNDGLMAHVHVDWRDIN